MRVADVIRAQKSEVESDDWYVGKITMAHWPLRLNAPTIRHPRSWTWRTIRFQAAGRRFRVLIELLEIKQYCTVTLALEDGGLIQKLCSHEYQAGAEPGWHCHAVYKCEHGTRDRSHYGMQRYPKAARFAPEGHIDKRGAMAIAVRFLRLDTTGSFL